MKILVVDDEQYVCDFLEEFLAMKGYKIDITLSGKEALAFVENKNYDLMLLDILMPDMSGLQVLEKMKEKKIEVPVIVVTGVKDNKIALEAINMGAVDYITKPIDLDRLEQSILVNSISKQKIN